jgi:nitroreductase
MLDTIIKRRSIRVYTQQDVTPKEVETLLEAAQAAPSANDSRPWAFVVVRDAGRRAALAQTHPWSGMCASAPVVIAVLGDPQVSRHWIEDCSAATENLLLAVTALELGAVWVAVYPEPARENHVRGVLTIPGNLRVLCLVPVGRPAESKAPRRRVETDKVYFETLGKQ